MAQRRQQGSCGDEGQVPLSEEEIDVLFFLPLIDSGEKTVSETTLNQLLTRGFVCRNETGQLELTPTGQATYLRLVGDWEF